MRRIVLAVLLMALITVVKAQAPQQMNYQGIARNSYGAPITYQNITVRISIIDSALGGQAVYSETRRVMTNYIGLFNIVIGSRNATGVLGSVAGVNWSTGRKFLKLEIDPHGFTSFSLAGVTELQSVPYALSATPSGSASGDLSGTYPAPTIANNAVTANKIADGNITFSKLAPNVNLTIAGKLNISDTAAMLAPYAGSSNVISSLATKLNISDTTAMLSPYYKSGTALLDLATKEDVANKSIDGTFASNSDTKYPSEKATKTYVDAIANTGSSDLAAEIIRATNAEDILTTNLSAETANRTNADATITTNLNNEVTRATNAEGV